MSARIDRIEAGRLLGTVPLGELMQRAHALRTERWPTGRVTYVRDTNPNYTNVCETGCRFCSFHRAPGAEDAYLLSPDELADRVSRAAGLGATTVLLQGGANPDVHLADWRAYLRAIRAACPAIHVHPFSPAEIAVMARREERTTREILEALAAEGIDTLPGGGAEILSERVQQRIAPHKCPPSAWLRIMGEAHSLGMRTTATMMYGHVETDDDIIEHLFRLRDLQDRTGGFSSFVPWSFKAGACQLTAEVPVAAHPARYVRLVATARLVLDNFPHIQSSWFSESPRAGQLALLAGADDFGGILVEENVLRSAGHARSTTEDEVRTLIREAGFEPARRNSYYEVLAAEAGDAAG